SLGVVANATPPLGYQWFFNETNTLSVGTNSSLALSNVQPTQAGAYSVLIGNTYGATTSTLAWVSVIPAVPRRTGIPVLQLTGDVGNVLHLTYSDGLDSGAVWQQLDAITLTNNPQIYMDFSGPLPAHRFYRAWQTNLPNVVPALHPGLATEISLTGEIGSKL